MAIDEKRSNVERRSGKDRRSGVNTRVIAAGNIGCMTQIAVGTKLPTVHTVELIDWATGGPCPPALRGRFRRARTFGTAASPCADCLSMHSEDATITFGPRYFVVCRD